MICSEQRTYEYRKWLVLFGINVFLIFIYYNIYIFQRHYGLDDYLMIKNPVELEYNALQNGRYALWGAYVILNKIGLNPVIYQKMFGMILALSFAICATDITRNIAVECGINKNRSILAINCGAILLFLNVFVTEWYTFVLSYPQWIMATVSSVYSSILIVQKKVYKKVMGFLLLAVAANSYQATLTWYAFLTMLFLWLRNKNNFNWKVLIKQTILVALPAIFVIVNNVILTNIFIKLNVVPSSSRYTNVCFDLNNIKAILLGQRSIWLEGQGVLGHGFLIICLCALIIMIIGLVKNKLISINSVIYCICILIGGQVVIYMPDLLMRTGLTLRSISPLFAIFTVLIVFLVLHIEKSKHMLIILGVAAFLLAGNFMATQKMAIASLQTNILEEYEAHVLFSHIKEYEKKENTKISYIGFCQDSKSMPRYKEIDITPYDELYKKAYVVSWADVFAVNYYTEQNYMKKEVPEAVEKYFLDKDWNEFNVQEQIIFQGDTVYWCVY